MADGVRLSDLVVAMARRGTPVASETGLFIALGIAEAVGARAPARVNPDDVRITPDGDVLLAPDLTPVAEPECVRAITAILEAVVDPAPANVLQVITRARAGSVASLPALCAQIEALLVPLNRGAARRVLGRLARDYGRAAAGSAASGGGAGALDTAPDRDAAPRPATHRRATPEPMFARDAQSAVATDPTGRHGAVNVIVEGPPASIPPIPPPPPLGSLADLPIGPSAVDTQPDPPTGYSDRPAARGADATELDGATRSDLSPAERTEPDRAPRGDRAARRTWLVLAAAVALIAAAAFMAYRAGLTGDPTPPAPPSAPAARPG